MPLIVLNRVPNLYCSKAILKQARFFSKLSAEPKNSTNYDAMNAWRIKSYGKQDKLELASVKKPIIKKPSQVLVKVSASSVNPIDIAMMGGYGNVILDLMRKCDTSESLPLTLGRDFSGVIIAKGSSVKHDFQIGDKIYGVLPVHNQGCHSELVVADESLIAHQPQELSDEEAAGVLYTSMTAWSALKVTGDLFLTDAKYKRSLVIGGSGGVGSAAIQMLKAWGSEVVTTCREDAFSSVKKLGADIAVDYSEPNWLRDLQSCGKYDIILDASGNVTPSVYVPLLTEWKNAKFITLRSPFLKNTDSFGLFGGMIQNVSDLVASNLSTGAIAQGSTVRWGYFLPIPMGVVEISQMVNQKKLKPIVEKVYPFENLPAAYDRVMEGHLRGKIIILMK